MSYGQVGSVVGSVIGNYIAPGYGGVIGAPVGGALCADAWELAVAACPASADAADDHP